MKKPAENLLIVLPISLGLLAITSGPKTIASESRKENEEINQQLDVLYTQNQDSGSQTTSVSQFSDVQPTDWAFQALQSLIERYNCISGYPDSTFRGRRTLNRYEFAASLSACLERVNEIISSATSDLVPRSDLDKIDRLTGEFKNELSQFRGRLDKLERRLDKVEANQFSTTTKLQGAVQFVVGGVLRGNNVITKQPAPRTITFQEQARLVLNSSFTGKDQLRLTLVGGNIESLGNASGAGVFGTFDGRTADNRSPAFAANQIILAGVRYRFPIGKNTQFNIFAQSDGANEIGLSGPTNPFEGSASNGISRFSRRNMVYNYGDTGPGIAILHNLSDQWQLGLSYTAPNGENPAVNNGLFAGRYVAFGQITYFSPKKNFRFGLSYANTYSPAGTLGQGGTNFGPAAGSNLANSIIPREKGGAGTLGNLYGVGALYRINPRLTFNVFGGYSAHRYLRNGDGEVWNWGAGLTFPDLGKKGSLGAIFAGMAPKLTGLSSNIDLGAGKGKTDKDTSLHIEGWYQYKLTDNIQITPGFIWITAPNSDSTNPASLVGWLRTTFTF